MGLGLGIGLGVGMGQIMSTNPYTAIYDAYTGTIPDAAQSAAQQTMVDTLVASGVWAKFDVLWVMANGDDPNMSLNWVNPGTYDASSVGLPTFEAWEGITGNGSSSYTNHNWIPATHGKKFKQDDASIGYYCRTNSDLTDDYELGTLSSTNTGAIMITGRTGSDALIRMNSADAVAVAHTNSSGLFVGNRTSSTKIDLWHNKVKIVDQQTVASNGLSAEELFSSCYNSDGAATAHSTRQMSMVFAGSHMTQADVESLTDAFEVYMDFLGKGVIT